MNFDLMDVMYNDESNRPAGTDHTNINRLDTSKYKSLI